MHTEVEILVCPQCRAELAHTIRHNGFKAASTSIGPPLLRCTSCDTLVYTDQKEWDQQNTLQKSWFVISRTMWLIAGSFFICGGAAGFLKLIAVHRGWIDEAKSMTFMAAAYGTGTLILATVFFRNSLAEIRESLIRSRSEEARAMWREAHPLPAFTDVVAAPDD